MQLPDILARKIRSRPGKPNHRRKAQNEKFMNFAHFCEFWCFLWETSTIHIELRFKFAPPGKVRELGDSSREVLCERRSQHISPPRRKPERVFGGFGKLA